MSDLEETFIHSVITEAFKSILEETLQSLGVETYDDFKFIEEADLLSALRPAQAQKALAGWKLKCKLSVTVCYATRPQRN